MHVFRSKTLKIKQNFAYNMSQNIMYTLIYEYHNYYIVTILMKYFKIGLSDKYVKIIKIIPNVRHLTEKFIYYQNQRQIFILFMLYLYFR